MSEPTWSKVAAGEYVSSDGYLAYRADAVGGNYWVLHLNDPNRPGLRVSKTFPTLRDAKAKADRLREVAQ